jgi:cellulose synthase/poly-beta-1,6-N-acetylglucosamine synthase-like glycosyltransferase
MSETSVLIPCYNAARWIGAAIQSALDCDRVSEVIVVDDGSSDESTQIVRTFGKRVSLITQAHHGGNTARNRLLAAARFEWLQFLDADDYLEPQKISRQLAEAGDLVSIDVLFSPVWEETWRDGAAISRDASTIDKTADLFTQWIKWQLPQTGGVLWRAASLRAIGGWNEKMRCCQEHELYLRALQAGLHWKFCPTPGAVYRLWSEDTVCRRDPVHVLETKTALIENLVAWLEQRRRLTAAHRAAASTAFFEMARTWARYDLKAANDYFHAHRARNEIRMKGTAAPAGYRLACHLLGFRGAEALARFLR